MSFTPSLPRSGVQLISIRQLKPDRRISRTRQRGVPREGFRWPPSRPCLGGARWRAFYGRRWAGASALLAS